MRKYFILTLNVLLASIFSEVFAQLPEVSTAEAPKWYYIQEMTTQDSPDERVFTNINNQMYGTLKYPSLSYTDINKQLWRFEKDEKGDYIIINKIVGGELSLRYFESTGQVRLMVASTPTTTWKLIKNSYGYYTIQAVTPIKDKESYLYSFILGDAIDENCQLILQTVIYQKNKNASFEFVEFEDPSPVFSDENSQEWYVIKSNKPGCENKCITDIVASSLPQLKFGIDEVKKGDYSQQWKLVKKSPDAGDNSFLIVNRATGNIIQTSFSQKDGYYYTQSTKDQNESNGWNVNHFGKRKFEIFGINTDGAKRYLNATVQGELPEEYDKETVVNSGFSWTLEKVDVTVGVDYIAKPNDWDDIKIYSENKRIYVIGADNYTLRTITGVIVDKNASHPAGVYLVTVNGKTKPVINQ
ncbi:hypothetical protein LJB92_01350 [Bacteroidales bacterium OttesenSCG-928-M06]|nr:hypothetical protein [Bacteroidales bacterium OttesenSCG-928-M06]